LTEQAISAIPIRVISYSHMLQLIATPTILKCQKGGTNKDMTKQQA